MSKVLIQVLATQEDIVHGLVAGLRSSAKAHLAAMVAGGIATTGSTPTEAIMKEWVLQSYDGVIATLPPGSPFIAILEEYRDIGIANPFAN